VAGTHEVAVRWHPFELNPGMPREGVERRAYRTAKFGADRGPGVPFFIVNGEVALSGAQPPETFLAAFERASDIGPVPGGGGACTVGPGGEPVC
jgi:predicted DsbA family dithiol-disulfide isomerase